MTRISFIATPLLAAALVSGCSLLRNPEDFSLRQADGAVDAADSSVDLAVDQPLDGGLGDQASDAPVEQGLDAGIDTGDGGVPACERGLLPDLRGECGLYRDFSITANHGCAIRSEDDALVCWGFNEFGAAFAPPTEGVEAPRLAMWRGPRIEEPLQPVLAHDVAVVGRATCFLWNDGEPDALKAGPAFCLGSNQNGRAGRPGAGALDHPMRVCSAIGGVDEPTCDASPLPDFVELAGRNSRFCALTSDGAVWCWGASNQCQLGDTAENQGTPRRVTTVANSADAPFGPGSIVMTDFATCVRAPDGRVTCFGNGSRGELGDGRAPGGGECGEDFGVSTVVRALGPDNVPLEGVRSLSANGQAICAATLDEVFCWGLNSGSFALPGAPGRRPIAAPLRAGFPTAGSTAIAFLEDAFCYWDGDEHARCRGRRNRNELGLGPQVGLFPVADVDFDRAPQLDGLRNVHGQNVFCGGNAGGQLRCWGYAPFGEFPRSNLSLEVPTPIEEDVETVALGRTGACIVDSASSVRCSGRLEAAERGVASDDRPFDGFEVIPGTSGSESVLRAQFGGCALKRDLTALCWGTESRGVLGGELSSPLETQSSLAGVSSVSMGINHACGLRNGEVVCWGTNTSGEVTTQASTSTQPPTLVRANGVSVRASHVAAGESFTCAVLGSVEGTDLGDQGRVLCWGDNSASRLGRPDPDPLPANPNAAQIVPGVFDATMVTAARQHACALTDAGEVYCWGANTRHEAGVNTGNTVPPTRVMGLPAPARALAATQHSSCAGLENGEVYCWGANEFHQLGTGAAVEQETATPQRVRHSFASDVQLFSHSFSRAYCAGPDLLGEYRCWGSNTYRRLGTSGSLYVNLPSPDE